jgi:hypothetical protein
MMSGKNWENIPRWRGQGVEKRAESPLNIGARRAQSDVGSSLRLLHCERICSRRLRRRHTRIPLGMCRSVEGNVAGENRACLRHATVPGLGRIPDGMRGDCRVHPFSTERESLTGFPRSHSEQSDVGSSLRLLHCERIHCHCLRRRQTLSWLPCDAGHGLSWFPCVQYAERTAYIAVRSTSADPYTPHLTPRTS